MKCEIARNIGWTRFHPQAAIEVCLSETVREFLAPLSAPADPSMRAGRHTIADLEKLLGSVVAPGSVDDAARKWPLGYSLGFVVLSSAPLWAGIIFGIARLV
jgi:hypothetical protein